MWETYGAVLRPGPTVHVSGYNVRGMRMTVMCEDECLVVGDIGKLILDKTFMGVFVRTS